MSKSHKVEFSPLCCHESTLTELHALTGSLRETQNTSTRAFALQRALPAKQERRARPQDEPPHCPHQHASAFKQEQPENSEDEEEEGGGAKSRLALSKTSGQQRRRQTRESTSDTTWEAQLHIPPETLSNKCTLQQLLQQLLTRCESAAHLPQTRRTSVHHASRRRAFVASPACKRASAAALLLLLRAH